MNIKYTDGQIKWLKENVENKTYNSVKEFVEAFNITFNENKSISSIKSKVNKDMGLQFDTKNNLTSEEKEWMNNNYKKYSFEDFCEKYNELFPTRHPSVLRSYLHNNNLYMKFYQDEENEWIKNNFDKYDTTTEMLTDFNKKFNRNKTIASFLLYCKRMGLDRYFPPTKNEIDWVIDNVKKYNYDDLSSKFNQIYNKDISSVLKK